MAEQPNPDTLTLLQYALGLGTVVGSSIAAFIGVKAKMRRKDEHRTSGPGTEWFFDGPIGRALETLQGMARTLDEARAENRRFADERNKKLDVQTELLREIKDNTGEVRSNRPRR